MLTFGTIIQARATHALCQQKSCVRKCLEVTTGARNWRNSGFCAPWANSAKQVALIRRMVASSGIYIYRLYTAIFGVFW